MGGTSIACVNSRDRNLLALRRDLLTAAYGVDQFLFVQGDKPSVGARTGELTVRAMIEEARAATDQEPFAGITPFRLGVTAGHRRRMASWKQAADFVFVQVGYSVEAFLRWREANPTDLPVYAGVMHVVILPIVLGRGVSPWEGLTGVEDRFTVESVASPSGRIHQFWNRKA